jgi:Tfp pilus assembly protein PilN
MSNNSLDETNSVSRSDQVLMWFVVGSLTLIEFALVALVGWLIFASSSSVELLIAMISAVVLVAALIFLTAARLFRVVGLEVTREGIRAELQPLREKIDETKRRIDELFLLSMSGDMFLNLEKLESGRFGYFRKGEGLDREL